MEKMNEEKILALVPSAVCDTAPIYKKSTQILPQVLHTQNTEKSEEQEMSILPSFQHIVTCYLAIIKTDYINTFIDYVKDKCNHIESMGLEGSCILRNIKRKMRRFLKFTKQHNDYVHQNLGWFQQRLFDIYITCNPYSHKTIEPPKVTTKFRPLLSVVTREAKFEESGEKFDKNTISNIVAIQDGIVTYSRHCMTICCITRNGDRNYVHCPSSVTDFTRIGQDIVLATLPFRKMILIIHPISFTIKTIQLELYLASYLEHSTLIGVEMFRKVIYLVNWDDDSIKRKIITKEIPAAIAVGPGKNILTSFSNSNEVVCYNPDGQQLFEVETHSMVLPTKLTFYQRHFYVLQGRIIYKVSATGGMKKRDIGRKYWDISVGKDIILVTDVFGIPHIIKTNKDFWPRLPYNHQLRTPSLNNHIYIEDCNSITNILPMSTSSILIIYSNKNAILFTDSGEIINQNNLTFLELPSIFCRINSNRFLVFYHEKKALQYIACPELRKGPLIKVHTDYIKICHIVSNKCLAVTTIESKNEIHILLIKEKKVDIIERISLKHNNVTIAATPVNFAVVDRREHKLVFYATSGEELFEKCLPFYGDPHHIYSDNVYFYVLFKRQSIVICYDIYGVIKSQWKLPLPVHPHIAIFQGTVYVLDIEHNRVLLYKYQNRSSGCYLHTKNPYIRHLNLRLKEKENDKKLVIAKICHLANGELVVSDINSDCLLYISKGGDIVSKLSLPSTSTDIHRWDSNQIGVTLPLEKQLRVIGNLSKTIRTVSLSQPYVLVCKLGKGQIVCYCDKASGFDILAIKNYNQVEIIHRINFPFVVKSLAIENETLNLLIVTGKKAFRYNTTFSGGGRCFSSFKMVPSVLLSQVKYPPNLYGGSIDKMFVYLIDNSRMFAINDHNLLVNDLVTNNQLNIYIDMVDVFSRNICVSEMLSSTIYQQDLTVSDKARRVHLPQLFGDENPVEIYRLVITENNLIAGYDDTNKNIKIFTFDGQLLDSIKMDANYDIKMCRGQSNTLVIMMKNYEYQLVVLKVEFPLSLVVYQTRNKYDCVASLSNNQLVCSCWNDKRSLYVVDVDEIHSTVNETLLTKGKQDYRNYITKIQYIKVTADNVIIALDKHFIIFFNSDGQHLHSFRHYMEFHACDDNITTDDSYLYTYGQWDKYHSLTEYKNIVCLTQTGEYSRVFLNQRIYKEKLFFPTINCKGPRFVGSRCEKNELYVEGYFMINREKIPISRLLTDKCPVQVKDIDISDEGKTVVCEQANNGNVKIFDKDGKLLCYRNVASLVGGVCFTQESHIMATVPKRKEIFQLQEQDLEKNKGWPSQVPYGVIWRKVKNIYWCVHIELIECHCIKIDGDHLNILESMSLLNLDTGLHFPSITSQMNKEIFSHELINKFKCSGGGGERDKSGEIIGEGRLKVRCGKYIAECKLGNDEISVRRMPQRTAMVPLSIPTFDEPVNYDRLDIKDRNSKLIKLNDYVSVLMFRGSVTLIRTTGEILQHKRLPQQQPLGICRWTDGHFIVAFGKELMVFNRDLCHLKTIKTEKYYNTIHKYKDNQLVCGGHYIRNITRYGRDKYERIDYNKKFYFFCNDPDAYDSYYVDVVDINDGKCKYEVCRGKTNILGCLKGESMVDDVGVTSFGDIVVMRRETKNEEELELYFDVCFVEWFREKSLVRRIKVEDIYNIDIYYVHRSYLTAIGEYVYITDSENNIYQIPALTKQQSAEDIEILTSKDIQKFLLLRRDDNEVFQVLGFDISENSFMVFGIIPGRQSFAFFLYDK